MVLCGVSWGTPTKPKLKKDLEIHIHILFAQHNSRLKWSNSYDSDLGRNERRKFFAWDIAIGSCVNWEKKHKRMICHNPNQCKSWRIDTTHNPRTIRADHPFYRGERVWLMIGVVCVVQREDQPYDAIYQQFSDTQMPIPAQHSHQTLLIFLQPSVW